MCPHRRLKLFRFILSYSIFVLLMHGYFALYSKFSYSHCPRFVVYFCGFSPGFDVVFSVLVKKLAQKSISKTTYFVSSGLSNLNQ